MEPCIMQFLEFCVASEGLPFQMLFVQKTVFMLHFLLILWLLPKYMEYKLRLYESDFPIAVSVNLNIMFVSFDMILFFEILFQSSLVNNCWLRNMSMVLLNQKFSIQNNYFRRSQRVFIMLLLIINDCRIIIKVCMCIFL